MTDKNPRHYWGITEHDMIIFTGTHSECWNKLMTVYADCAMRVLKANGIKLSRVK